MYTSIKQIIGEHLEKEEPNFIKDTIQNVWYPIVYGCISGKPETTPIGHTGPADAAATMDEEADEMEAVRAANTRQPIVTSAQIQPLSSLSFHSHSYAPVPTSSTPASILTSMDAVTIATASAASNRSTSQATIRSAPSLTKSSASGTLRGMRPSRTAAVSAKSYASSAVTSPVQDEDQMSSEDDLCNSTDSPTITVRALTRQAL